MPTFDTSPEIGSKVIVKTAGNVYVGVVRRTTLHPSSTITLIDTFHNNTKKFIGGIEGIQFTGGPNDQWRYLSNESPLLQSKLEEIYATYYAHKMKTQMESIIATPDMSPSFRDTMLQGIPDNIRAAHYKSMMEDIDEHPAMTRNIMLDVIPAEIQEPYNMEARMNRVSRTPFDKLGPLPADLVYDHIIGKRPTKHAGRRFKTNRKKTKRKSFMQRHILKNIGQVRHIP